ncbi:Lar family restriction alleviation protein [Candidatus Pacearchaeota archaeon]|nr:Lar family restriction alleviation protein [Candidatus Pacearchaeota archaeon]
MEKISIENQGHCPRCGGDNIEFEGWNADGETGWDDCTCLTCGAYFQQVYDIRYLYSETTGDELPAYCRLDPPPFPHIIP